MNFSRPVLLMLLLFVADCNRARFSDFREEKLSTGAYTLSQGKKLAESHCAACHLPPDPASMTQTSANFVLAYMGLFLGVDASRTLTEPLERKQFQIRFAGLKSEGQVPTTPAISRESWDLLRNYYLAFAKQAQSSSEKAEAVQPLKTRFAFDDQAITLLYTFADNSVAIGGGLSNLLRIYSAEGKLIREKKFSSPPVSILKDAAGYYVLTLGDLLGSLNPAQNSELWHLTPQGDKKILDGLPRSSHFEVVGRSGGGNKFLISSFGSIGKGKFSLFQSDGNKITEKVISRRDSHVRSQVLPGPGPLRVLSLVAGAREQLILFTETDSGFSESVLAEYPPHYGSVWLEVADLDGDGTGEILVLSGDNADAGPFNEIKEDQGLRIYHLSGNKLDLAQFVSLPGALSLHLVKRPARLTDIAVARFYTPNAAKSDLTILLNKGKLSFEKKDIRLNSRATVITSFTQGAKTNLLVGSGNMPKLEIINGQIDQRDFTGNLLTELAIP